MANHTTTPWTSSQVPRPTGAPSLERPPPASPADNCPPDVVDETAAEVMAETSADGRPPTKSDRERSAVALVVALGVVAGGIILLLMAGGLVTVGMGIVLLVVMCGAAFPVWVAALLRAKERRQAEEQARRLACGLPPQRPTSGFSPW